MSKIQETRKDIELSKKFPKVFGACPFGIDCRESWLPDLEKLFGKIEEEVQRSNLNDFKVLQVKEKFGTVRIYTSGANDEITDMIRVLEYTLS